MAFVHVTEFTEMAATGDGDSAPIARWPAAAQQRIAIGGTSVQSAAFGGATNFIRVHCDAICSINVGGNPTALAAHVRMAAGQTEYFGVNPGDKIAVITNS